MNNSYDDIIGMPHHVSETHPHMSMSDRAAQFSPFAALTGHEDAIKETARLTDMKYELDDEEIKSLNEKIQIMREYTKTDTEFTVTYFIPDRNKDGGHYETYTGTVYNIDDYKRKIIFSDRKEIQTSDILSIEYEAPDLT